jgi:hypothetical protein
VYSEALYSVSVKNNRGTQKDNHGDPYYFLLEKCVIYIMQVGTRVCINCQISLPITDFSSHTVLNSSGEAVEYHRRDCKKCFFATTKRPTCDLAYRLTEEEIKSLTEACTHYTKLKEIHRIANLKMSYSTFYRYAKAGDLEAFMAM